MSKKPKNSDKQIDSLREEKNNLESSYQQLQSINFQLKQDTEQLRHEISESRDNISSRVLENDPVFENYKKKQESNNKQLQKRNKRP
jgi:hypothetical protein